MRNLWRGAALAGFVVSLVAVGTPPAGAAVSTAAFCVNVAPGTTGFNDIGGVAIQQRNDIECLALSGITSGTSATGYSPSGTAFRDSMASFVARLIDTANSLELVALVDLPAPAAVPEAFTDDEQSVHENNINRLAAARIVFGKGEGYGPNGPGNEVNRGQMAAFLVRALEFMRGGPLAAGGDAFGDDAGPFEADINKLAALDIVDGVGDGTRYAPNDNVSRAQMASFLIRALAFLEDQNQIRVLPQGTRTIALNPGGDVANTTDAAAGDEVAFTANQIAATDVDVALFPCENVAAGASTTTFLDTTPDDNAADPGGDLVLADIVAVNGTAQAADAESASAVAVANSAITFTVDSPSPDCVVAVVWDDADDDNALDLSGVGVPTERFGRSGQVSFRPPAAATGAMDEQVVPSDPGAGSRSFVGCEIGGPNGAGSAPEEGINTVSATDCFTFTYDDGDLFFADPDGAGVLQPGTAISLTEFERALSSGDDVAGDYNATASGQSTFRLVDESPTAPGGGSAATVDADTINVTFNEVPGADAYSLYRNADPGPLSCPAFTTTGNDPYVLAVTFNTVSDSDANTTVLVADHGLTASTRYCYVVTSVDEGDEFGPSASFNGSTSADTVPPQAVDTELTTSTGTPANFDNGDVIQICFDQDIADPEAGPPVGGTSESIRLRDNDSTVATLTQGGNATFRRGSATTVAVTAGTATPCEANRVLEITVTGAVTPTTAGGNSILNVPATIDLATDIQDTNGTRFQPAGDPDVTVDVEGTEPG